MHDLGDKRGIFEEKMGDFCVNEEFSKRKRVIFVLNGGFSKRKCMILKINGGFLKRKWVISAYMADFRRENG